MPELPEVETICRRLQPLLVGKVIDSIEVLHPKVFSNSIKNLVGSTITDVTRRAKIIQFNLDDETYLVSHLKMTGQWIYVDDEIRVGGGHPTADWVQDLPSKHTRLIIHFSDGSNLFFNDQRIFGWVRHYNQEQLDQEYAKLGPDVNQDSVTAEYLQEKLSRRGIAIKQAIMDNAIMCGVGNIYACDALNLAKISPTRPAKSLSAEEVVTLLEAAKTVINRGIELGGATIHDYVHVDGFAGKYQTVVLAYEREGQDCKNCGSEIKKMKLGGRGTYWCEVCQV